MGAGQLICFQNTSSVPREQVSTDAKLANRYRYRFGHLLEGRDHSDTRRFNGHLNMGSDTNSLDRHTTEYTENLLQCMQDRLGALTALRQLADSQADAATGGDVNVTLGILARKQTLLDQLSVIQQRLQPFFDDDPEARVWTSPERREACRQHAYEGSRLLQEIMQLEKTALDEMAGRREAVAAQLQDGKDSILAHTAYTADSMLCESALDIGDL